MLFKFGFIQPATLDIGRLEDFHRSLGLSGQVRIWELEEADENLLGMVNMFSPMVIEIKPTPIVERLEGRIAHEITHIHLSKNGYRNLDIHDEHIRAENMYDECIHVFSNFLHHQILYKKIIDAGFTLEDDMEIVQRYYTDFNINRMVQAYQSQEKFAKAWVVISIMNDLIRLSNHGNLLHDLLNPKIPEAMEEAKQLLGLIGDVNMVEEYEHSKSIIEESLNLPTYSFSQ